MNDAFDALFVNVDTCDLEKDDSADTSSSRLTELGESKASCPHSTPLAVIRAELP